MYRYKNYRFQSLYLESHKNIKLKSVYLSIGHLLLSSHLVLCIIPQI